MKRRISISAHAAFVIVLGALAVAFAPFGLKSSVAKALGLTLFTIGFWATGVLPEYLTALAFFALAMLSAVSPAQVVFSGFTSGVVWLVFGGLVLGVAIQRTGLGTRIANRLAARFGKSYASIIAGMTAVGMALSFLVPATVSRVILITPVAAALAGRFGFAKGSNGFTGVMMAAVFGTFLPAFAVLTANAPNLVLAGAAETLYGFTPAYGKYLWLHFPVLGIVKALLLIGLILFLYPDRPEPEAAETSHPAPMSRDEIRLGIILAVTIGLWLTDFWHHISPAWIALAAGVVCLLPLFSLVPAAGFRQEVNFGTLFFLAGIIGFSAMLRDSGLGSHLARFLLKVLPLEPGSALANYLSITAATFLTGIATTLPAVPAVLTPLAGEISHAAALPIATTLMIEVIGFSLMLFPYQAPPVVLAIQMGGLKTGTLIRFFILMTAATIVVVLPLNFLWWRILGWI